MDVNKLFNKKYFIYLQKTISVGSSKHNGTTRRIEHQRCQWGGQAMVSSYSVSYLLDKYLSHTRIYICGYPIRCGFIHTADTNFFDIPMEYYCVN